MSTVGVPSSTVLSPGVYDKNRMVSIVLRRGQGPQNDPELEQEACDGLNSGISRINTQLWKKLTKTQDITLTASTRDYALSSNFKDPIQCDRLDTNSKIKGYIEYRPKELLSKDSPDQTTDGEPLWYTIHYDLAERELSFEFPPSTAFVAAYPTVRLRYHYRASYLDETNSITGLPPEFDWFLIWHARGELMGNRDPSQEGACLAQAERNWKELRKDDLRLQTDMSIR